MDPLGPQGVHARTAWSLGHLGQGASLVCVETSWQPHPDIPPLEPVLGAPNPASGDHGSHSLAVALGPRHGVAPGARLAGIAPTRPSPDGIASLVQATAAALKTSPDVLLINLSLGPTLPVPVAQPMRALLAQAHAQGVCTILPAANGSADLNMATCVNTGAPVLRGGQPQPWVLVGAVDPRSGARLGNRGAAVACSGWGRDVPTLERQGVLFGGGRGGFSGTSAAAALVAGVALVLVGAWRSEHRQRMPPSMLCRLLSDPQNQDRYGVPDLRALLLAAGLADGV